MAHHTCSGTRAPEEKEGARTAQPAGSQLCLCPRGSSVAGMECCEILVATYRQLCERGAKGRILTESGLLLIPE